LTASDFSIAMLALTAWQQAGGVPGEAAAIAEAIVNRAAATDGLLTEAVELINRLSTVDTMLIPDSRDPRWVAFLRGIDGIVSRRTAQTVRGGTEWVDLTQPGAAVPFGMTHTARVGRLSFFKMESRLEDLVVVLGPVALGQSRSS
jgi:hypothetical protein